MNKTNHKEDIDFLKNQLTLLFSIYYFYKHIFRQENEKILNQFPFLFSIFQMLMLDYLILGISRLLDSYKQGRNKNLTIETLIEEVATDNNKKVLRDKLNNIKSKFNNLKKMRNKLIAHLDYSEIKKPRIINTKDIEETLKELEELINEISDKGFIPNAKKAFVASAIRLPTEHEIDYLFYVLKNKHILEGLEFLSTILDENEKIELFIKCEELLDRHSPNLKNREEYRNLINFILKKDN